jgi:hypothetical protein
MKKKQCNAIGPATQFLSCIGHLRLTICIVQLIAVLSKQLIFNYYAIPL